MGALYGAAGGMVVHGQGRGTLPRFCAVLAPVSGVGADGRGCPIASRTRRA